MSLKAICKTEFDNQEDLIASLQAIYGNRIKVNEAGFEVRGYTSDVKPTIKIDLDGLFGTAGFFKNKDGKFELVYDSTDVRSLQDVMPQKGANGQVINRLAQEYSKLKVLRALSNLKGAKVTSHQKIGRTVKLKVRV